MTVKTTDIAQNLAAPLFAKTKEAAVLTSLQETSAQNSSIQETAPSSGDRGLKRIPIGNKDAAGASQDPASVDATSTTSSTDTSTVEAYQTINQLMFALLSEVTGNLSTTQNLMAAILNYEAEQAQSLSDLAQTNQTNLNEQLDEQARRQKKMRFVSWAVKGLIIGVAAASVVASGGLSAAPVSALLMLSLTALTIAKPDLLNNQIIEPLAAGLEKEFNLPPKVATLMAEVIVISAVVAMTAGAGAADSGLIAKSGVDYAKLITGEISTNAAFMTGVTNPYSELLQIAFPNHPMIAELVGTSITIGLSAGLGIAGGMQIASSGTLSNGIGETEAVLRARFAIAIMDVLKGGTEGAAGWMTIEQGLTEKDIANIQAALTQIQASLKQAQGFTKTTQSAMQMNTKSLEDVAQATYSLTKPAAAVA